MSYVYDQEVNLFSPRWWIKGLLAKFCPFPTQVPEHIYLGSNFLKCAEQYVRQIGIKSKIKWKK